MKIKLQIKDRFTGSSIFEYKKEDNTVRDTVIAAVKSRANLSGADLSGADLSRAKNAEMVIAITRICPDGDLIGWKKCDGGVIVKLLIPKEAKRNNGFGRKCRAEFADVLEIEGADKAYSQHDKSFVYEVGKRVYPTEKFDENFQEECSTGIHFFITKEEAKAF